MIISNSKLILKHKNNKIKIAKYDVNGDIKIESISIVPNSIELKVGETVQLSANILPSNATNKNIEWQSGDTSLFTVSNDGLVTTIKEGSNYINCYATDGSGVIGECIVDVVGEIVNPPVIDNDTPSWISTYYFNAKPYNDEEVIIPLYITDYEQSEYLARDNSNKFTLRVELDDDVRHIKDVPIGDYNLNLGVLAEGDHFFSVQVTDSKGRESHRLFNELMVVDRNTYDITPSQTYTIIDPDLVRYGIKNNNSTDATDLLNTRIGLTALFQEIKDNGYRKCIMPKGIYRILKAPKNGTGNDSPIRIPSMFTIDMNGSTIKQHETDGHTVPADAILMVGFYDCIDSHLINGVLEGDYSERSANGWISGGQGEHSHCLDFFGGKYNTVDTVTITNITGYSMLTNFGTHIYHGAKLSPWIDNSSIDENGDDVNLDGKCTSSYADLTKLLDCGYFSVNVYLGGGGICGDSPIIDMYFYDENKNYLEKIKGMQYRYCKIPNGSKYVRVVASGNSESLNQLSVDAQKSPRYCALKNIEAIDNRTCFAPFQFNNLLYENINFTRSGQSITPCCIDLEDGWEQATDFYMRGCKVLEKVGTRDLIVLAGFNHVIENCDNFFLDLRTRIKGLTVRNNTECNLMSKVGHHSKNTYRIYNNDMIALNMKKANNEITTQQKIYNCRIDTGYADGIHKDNFELVDSEFINWGHGMNLNISSSIVRNNGDKAYLGDNIFIKNSVFKAMEGEGTSVFAFNYTNANREYISNIYDTKCIFKSFHGFNNGMWLDCKFIEDVQIITDKDNIMGDISFTDCTFEKNISISLKNNAKVQFNNCIFKGEKTFLYNGQANSEFNNCIE